MQYRIFGRIHPERVGAWLAPQVWQSAEGHSFTLSCDSSQLIVCADFATNMGHLDAFILAEQVAQAVVSALGFALGTGYSVELVQVVSETGEVQTFGVRPGNLHFEPSDPVLLQAAELAKKDVFFRMALRDYARAMSQTIDCAHYCYRAIEAIESAFAAATGGDGWLTMHTALGTTKEEIKATVQDYADPVRHGNWSAVKPSTALERNSMLLLTRDILTRYMRWKEKEAA